VSAAVAARGRHRRSPLILPPAPDDTERDSYAWRSLPYLAVGLAISSLFLIIAQALFEARNPIAWPFAAYTLIYLIYQLLSLPVNYAGRSFDLAAHQDLVGAWRPARYPSIDIFLPICGEPMPVLHNTWEGVFELVYSYPGMTRVYVLDDGPSDAATDLAASFGFSYVRRPNLREHKKSGNLRYAYERTSGDHIVIFDADFRPRPDFLAQTLPYMQEARTGLVQTPQFFRTSRNQTWIERAASASLEIFYRAVQVSRDRFGSALCVGSNAVYRRAALDDAGGFTQIPYAEDSHTGLAIRYHGWQLKYIPVALAAGVCPATVDTFMRQQYRWCCGATSLVWTGHMWRVPMKARSRLPYVAGWLWNLTTALRVLVLPLIPITLLAFLPDEIRLRNVILLIPAILTGVVLYPIWHNARYPLSMWPLAIALGWAQALALWDYSQRKVMSWQPSRGPADATRRFRRAVVAWNGTLAVAWLVLAAWRTDQTGSTRFLVVAAFGAINAIVTARVIFPGRPAR
jgi:cellulose synthase (UDP-forming)